MTPKDIVQKMLDNDAFSLWLGIEVIECKKGEVNVKMLVSSTMTNGFKIAHGGISYSLADSALAFTANSYGYHALSVETSIAHVAPIYEGDQLETKVKELSKSKKLGRYQIIILNQNKERVAFFNGTVYFKNKEWS